MSLEDEDSLFQRWHSWLEADVENVKEWDIVLNRQTRRRLFWASNKKIVRVWESARNGDIICIMFGCDVPLVLRPVRDHYELIGDCYMDGIMEGQAMKDLEEHRVELETFDLH